VGCRSGDKRQRSICSLCTTYVRGRVGPGKCRGSEEGSEGRKVYRAGAWAVGQATSVSGAQMVCVECTYMEESLPGSVGAARKAVRGEGPTEPINAARGL